MLLVTERVESRKRAPESLPNGNRARKSRGQIDASSVHAVATDIGVSREALARFLAGLPVHAGTVALIRQGVALQREARR